MNRNEIIIFETEDHQIKLEVNVESETVWLSANQMALLFERDEKTIRKISILYIRCHHFRWLSCEIKT